MSFTHLQVTKQKRNAKQQNYNKEDGGGGGGGGAGGWHTGYDMNLKGVQFHFI